jgi:hypothetical protein
MKWKTYGRKTTIYIIRRIAAAATVATALAAANTASEVRKYGYPQVTEALTLVNFKTCSAQ